MVLPMCISVVTHGELMRIALGVEYDGTNFSGWQAQTQANIRTVQECVEQALTKVANHPVRVVCAGRTDTGVHGLGQVIHMDVTAERPMRSWILGANANLPHDIAITWAQEVDEEFHARFSAVERQYRYVILNRMTRPAILAYRATWQPRPLDVSKMQAAAKYLIGTHDFSSFRASACQAKSPIRTIYDLTVYQEEEKVIIEVRANAFLHHMVRNIAGVLMAVGSGEQPVDWVSTVLAYKDRALGGVTAAPYGLYFMGVGYPAPYQFPAATTISI